MKLKSILSAFAAVALFAVGCTEEPIAMELADLQVSDTYVALPANGGSASVTVSSNVDWAFDGVPEWLTVTPANGAAGETTVNFSAAASTTTKEAVVKILVGETAQYIHIQQGVKEAAKPSTAAEVNAGPDGKTYQITGTCVQIANTQYGNWYIEDETGKVYVYGTLNNGETKKFDSLNPSIEVGDVVTIEGPKTTYNGTVELVDVTVLKVEKSLLKLGAVTVGADTTSTLPAAGGDITFSLDNKGNGIYVSVPEDAKSWLTIKSVDGNKITFSATGNNAGPRGASIVFSTTDGKKDYTATAEMTQLGASGTIDVPFTVEEAMAFCKNLTAPTTDKYYVKGIVTKIQTAYGAKYGNGSFWISSDGVGNGDKANEFEVYNCYWFDNAMWTEANKQVSVGDEVVVYGQLTNYNGTCETNGKQCNIISINGLKTDAEGLGSKDYPLTIKGACAFCSTLTAATDLNYYVTGTVCELTKYQYGPTYNTASFWLSDDGTTAGDKFEAYSIYYMNNPEHSSSVSWPTDGQLIEVGQKIVLYGQLTNYNGTCETNGKKAHIISINGKTE